MYDKPYDETEKISDLYNDLVNSIELLRFRDGFQTAANLAKELKE